WLSDFWTHLAPYTQQVTQAIEILKRQTATAISALQDRAGVQAIQFNTISSANSDDSDWEHVEHPDAVDTSEETGANEPEIIQIEVDGSTRTVTEAPRESKVNSSNNDDRATASVLTPRTQSRQQLASQQLPSAQEEAEEALKQFYFTDLKPSARYTSSRSPSGHTLKPRKGQVAPISLPESIEGPSDPNKRSTQGRHIYLPDVPNKIAGRSSAAGAIQLPEVPDSITSRRR
ncbi:hypothetical protein SARC_13758, partial [Sphaeroforma arctica JP610]